MSGEITLTPGYTYGDTEKQTNAKQNLGFTPTARLDAGAIADRELSTALKYRGLNVATVAALKALSVGAYVTGVLVYVSHYALAGDGGGGWFRYDSASSTTDDGGSYIAPDSGSGRWVRIFNGFYSVRHWGATGDGTTDDYAAMQAALTYCDVNFVTLDLPPGDYKTTQTLIKPQRNTCPSIRGSSGVNTSLSGKRTRLFTASAITLLKIKGGSGVLCGAVISNIVFDGLNTSTALEIADQCGVKIRDCSFHTLRYGIDFHNEAGSSFTEFNVAQNCYFAETCRTKLRYRLTSGNSSFHGSGLEQCVLDESATETVHTFEIGTGALVYNAPFSFHLFKRNTTAIFITSSAEKFIAYGHFTLESDGLFYFMNGATAACAFVGTFSRWGGTAGAVNSYFWNGVYHCAGAVSKSSGVLTPINRYPLIYTGTLVDGDNATSLGLISSVNSINEIVVTITATSFFWEATYAVQGNDNYFSITQTKAPFVSGNTCGSISIKYDNTGSYPLYIYGLGFTANSAVYSVSITDFIGEK